MSLGPLRDVNCIEMHINCCYKLCVARQQPQQVPSHQAPNAHTHTHTHTHTEANPFTHALRQMEASWVDGSIARSVCPFVRPSISSVGKYKRLIKIAQKLWASTRMCICICICYCIFVSVSVSVSLSISAYVLGPAGGGRLNI